MIVSFVPLLQCSVAPSHIVTLDDDHRSQDLLSVSCSLRVVELVLELVLELLALLVLELVVELVLKLVLELVLLLVVELVLEVVL